MLIFNKPYNQLKYEDIVEFCKEGHIEGTQLDYKKELPKKGLAKDFAAFSNTRGGIIIIGVEENHETSVPEKYDGVVNNKKIIDRIHQYASSVDPIPNYNVYNTQEKDGKIFIIIDINEGDKTPYYVFNDSNIWVRTGNIKFPVNIASPEQLKSLFKKREESELVRNTNIKFAEEIVEASLRMIERERVRTIDVGEDMELIECFKKQNFNSINCTGTFTIVVQPFFPNKALITPRNILENVNNICVNNFPDYGRIKTIPEGIKSFLWDKRTGRFECQQIYSNGFLCDTIDVLENDDKKSRKYVILGLMADTLLKVTKCTKLFYDLIGYKGCIKLDMHLRNVEGAEACRMCPIGYSLHNDNDLFLLPNYDWTLNIDYSLLQNNINYNKFFINIIKKIYWSFGYKDVNEKLIIDYLAGKGY